MGNIAIGATIATANFGVGYLLGNVGLGLNKNLTEVEKVARFVFKAIFKSIAFGSLSFVLKKAIKMGG